MKEMGWTFEAYRQTPHSIIAEIWAMMLTENKALQHMMEDTSG